PFFSGVPARRCSSSFTTRPASTPISTLSLRDALPIYSWRVAFRWHDHRWSGFGAAATDRGAVLLLVGDSGGVRRGVVGDSARVRSEEHTSELQSREHLVCRLLLDQQKYHGAAVARLGE